MHRKKVRSLKFRNLEEQGLNYPFNENKCTDHVCSAVIAQLICAVGFALSHMQIVGYLMRWLN